MTHVTCRLTAKNRDQLWNPTLGNRVWATFTFFTSQRSASVRCVSFHLRRSWTSSPLVLIAKFHYTDLHGLCDQTRSDQTDVQSPYVSRLSGQVYDQTKSGGLVGDPSGSLVWSGRVRLVEFGHNCTWTRYVNRTHHWRFGFCSVRCIVHSSLVRFVRAPRWSSYIHTYEHLITRTVVKRKAWIWGAELIAFDFLV